MSDLGIILCYLAYFLFVIVLVTWWILVGRHPRPIKPNHFDPDSDPDYWLPLGSAGEMARKIREAKLRELEAKSAQPPEPDGQ